MKRVVFTSLALLLLLALAACNLPAQAQPTEDIGAGLTAAAVTIQAQLTAQAPLPTATSAIVIPTNTLPPPTVMVPTNPPPTAAIVTATSSCNSAQFIADVTIPDGTILQPSALFTKTWRLKNNGTCSWTPSYAAVFSTGNAMGGPATQALTGNVNPGQTVDISINFTAPATPGNYTAYYKLRDAAGVQFSQFYVQIKVQAGGGDGDDTSFAVTSVVFSQTGSCGNFTATADIYVNGAGTVKYYWKWSDGATDTVEHAPLVFTAAGHQTVSTDWDTTVPGSRWIDIYISSPNHQQFGRASFSCP
jgi:hypothetical protein